MSLESIYLTNPLSWFPVFSLKTKKNPLFPGRFPLTLGALPLCCKRDSNGLRLGFETLSDLWSKQVSDSSLSLWSGVRLVEESENQVVEVKQNTRGNRAKTTFCSLRSRDNMLGCSLADHRLDPPLSHHLCNRYPFKLNFFGSRVSLQSFTVYPFKKIKKRRVHYLAGKEWNTDIMTCAKDYLFLLPYSTSVLSIHTIAMNYGPICPKTLNTYNCWITVNDVPTKSYRQHHHAETGGQLELIWLALSF